MVIQTLESYSRRPFPTLKQFGAFWDGKPISTRWSSFVFLTNDTWTHKTSKQQTVITTDLQVGLDCWNGSMISDDPQDIQLPSDANTVTMNIKVMPHFSISQHLPEQLSSSSSSSLSSTTTALAPPVAPSISVSISSCSSDELSDSSHSCQHSHVSHS